MSKGSPVASALRSSSSGLGPPSSPGGPQIRKTSCIVWAQKIVFSWGWGGVKKNKIRAGLAIVPFDDYLRSIGVSMTQQRR